jgi:molybdopterin-guanine dinucleotide biosynthesis protein A
LACRTAPPLDALVFQQFCSLLKTSGKLNTVKFREEEGRLHISAASWTPQLRDTIESLLTNAENASAQAQKAQAEKTRLERHKKERAIEAAATALGVPIK